MCWRDSRARFQERLWPGFGGSTISSIPSSSLFGQIFPSPFCPWPSCGSASAKPRKFLSSGMGAVSRFCSTPIPACGGSKSTVEAARTLGAKTDEMLRRVVFYHSLPLIITGARISFAVGMIVIIAAEMVAADAGLGYMILTAQQTFHTPELYAGITTIAVIGFLGDRIIRLIRAKLCPWYVEIEQS